MTIDIRRHCACSTIVEPVADRPHYFYCPKCDLQTNSVERLDEKDIERAIRGAVREWTGVNPDGN